MGARQLKRTRSGCLNCRRKRRKCDETKPACLRCQKRDECCQWGTRVTFRAENAQMLAHDRLSAHPQHPKDRTPRSFQIMDVTPEVIRDYNQSLPNREVQNTLPGRESSTVPRESHSQRWREEKDVNDSAAFGAEASQLLDLDDPNQVSSSRASSACRTNGNFYPDCSGDTHTNLSYPADRTELTPSAAFRINSTENSAHSHPWLSQVLRKSPPAITSGPGADTNSPYLPEFLQGYWDPVYHSADLSHEDGIFLPGSEYLELHSTLRSRLMQEVKSLCPSWRGTPDDLGPARLATVPADFGTVTNAQQRDYEHGHEMPNPIPADLPKDVEYTLWKNWLEEIAPWLDKFDNDRHFQYALPMMAQSHDHLRFAMLALSARQLEQRDKTSPNERSLLLYHQAINHLLPQLPTRSTAVIASCVVLCVLEMLSCAPKAWRRHLDGCAGLMQAVGITGFVGGVEQALFWCFARMDVCGGLISSIKTLIPVNNWASGIDLDTDIELFRSKPAFDTCANQAVYLCAQVLDLLAPSHSLGRVTSSWCHLGDKSFAERWLKLWCYLEDWQTKRPIEMKPIIKYSSTNVFPSILFSNSAAISGNQLYHTAAVLLLHTKPASVRLDPKPRSILWHARQICGISISNDHHGAWTNSIQPLWIAGQWMSHPSEHRVILELLHRIERESGWPTRWRADDLREFWGDLSE